MILAHLQNEIEDVEKIDGKIEIRGPKYFLNASAIAINLDDASDKP